MAKSAKEVNLDLYYWVAPTSTDKDGIPKNAFVGGHEKKKDEKVYVGRADHEGNLIPGKIIIAQNACYVGWDLIEHKKTSDFEFLCEQKFDWVAASGGKVPPKAVQAGHTMEDEPLYIGRTNHQGALIIGKIHPSHKCVYIASEGKEHNYSDYEALVLQ